MDTISPPPLAVEHSVLSQADVLSLRGDLDIYTVLRLREVALDADACAARTLVIDLSELAFLDSTGIGTLVAIRRSALRRGVELVLVADDGWIRRLLAVVGLDTVITVVASVDAALERAAQG